MKEVPKRDRFPLHEERAARWPTLFSAPAMPLNDLALLLCIPLSSIDKLRAQGKGPKCFKIGRRLYVLRADVDAWLERLHKEEAVT